MIAALIALVLQTSFLTPPFGAAVFLKRCGPGNQYHGFTGVTAWPQLMVVNVFFMPQIVIWLPTAQLEIGT